MAANEYRFLTRWRFEATVEEVFALIDSVSDYVRWWPSVWLKVEILQRDDPQGIGGRARITSKGWLPYILVWEGTTLEKEPPYRKVVSAKGDFEGRGVWTLAGDGPFVTAEYQWQVTADKPLLKYLSFLLRPVFAANHQWAMARGEESLRLELARRRARNQEQRAAIPAPPQPTFLGTRRRKQLGLEKL